MCHVLKDISELDKNLLQRNQRVDFSELRRSSVLIKVHDNSHSYKHTTSKWQIVMASLYSPEKNVIDKYSALGH